MGKFICQECGQQLSSLGEKHTYNDCGQYHLKRAQEILGFNFESMSNDIRTLSERLYAEQTDVLESDAKLSKIAQVVGKMVELARCAPVPSDEALNIFSANTEELNKILSNVPDQSKESTK